MGAADVRGEPVPASLGKTATLEPIGGASAHGPLMANEIGWEEVVKEGFRGQAWSFGLLSPLPYQGLLELTSHVSRGSPVSAVLGARRPLSFSPVNCSTQSKKVNVPAKGPLPPFN